MKGLILSGGTGSRLRPLTFTRAKQLIPVANKPVLFYAVEDLVKAGISSIGVVVNPETSEEVKRALDNGNQWGARFTFIPQGAPLGLAHAVKTARNFLENDAFVMYLGDNLLSGGIAHLVEEYQRSMYDAMVLLTQVDNPREFGVAELGEDGQVLRLVEKPQDPPSNLALVGIYLFSAAIHEIVDLLKPSGRGEYEITDAIQALIDRRYIVKAHLVRGWWKDTGRPEDILEANRLVLSQSTRSIEGDLDSSDVVGNVVVKPGARVAASIVRGPAHIAEGALIEHSYIGPYTSIGRNARVIHSQVEYSVIIDEAEVRDLPQRLDASIIGQGVVVSGNSDSPRKHTLRLILGDRSHVQL